MLEGTILRNRYRIQQLIGRGGMADVYLAFDQRRFVSVAIKVLREDLAEDPEFINRFTREAQALAQLDHPNIVRFYSFERQGSLAFIVMDYVEGVTLRRVLAERRGPLPLPQVTSVLSQVGSALHYAHVEGIIHRDLKPGNVMVRTNGDVLITDFGIAKVMESATITTAAVGTPAYMSPEQILGKPLDARSDIYSLGVLLFYMATGRRPFTGKEGVSTGAEASGFGRIREAHLHTPPPDPREFNPAISSEAAAVILRALAKQPEARWQDVPSMVQAWRNAVPEEAPLLIPRSWIPAAGVVSSAGASSMPSWTPPATPSPPPPSTPAPAPTSQPSNRRGLMAGIAVAAIILLFLMGGFLMLQRRPTSPPSPAPTEVAEAPPSTDETSPAMPAPPPTEVQTPTAPPASPPPTDAQPPSPTLEPIQPPAPASTQQAGDIVLSPKDGMELVYIPEGFFWMGSETDDPDADEDEFPKHLVFLDAYWMDRTEVTNAMFAAFVNATGYRTEAERNGCSDRFVPSEKTWKCTSGLDWRHPQGPGSYAEDDHPVVAVSWEDARAYCEWAGRRLPTEAEWEKAARGEEGLLYPWGNAFRGDAANFCDVNCPESWARKKYDDGYDYTAPVGSYPRGKSPYGIYDLGGNVWEWVSDFYSASYYAKSPERNPEGPSSGTSHAVRGGSWINTPEYLRTANRGRPGGSVARNNLGFRCALSTSP